MELIADACDAAALSASRIAVADTEVARIVALEQVEAQHEFRLQQQQQRLLEPKRLERAKEREGGGGLKTPTAPMTTRMRSQRSGRVTVAQNCATLSARGTTNTH